MPTYEYRCPQGHRFEVTQKITDDKLKTCPTHPEESVERLISSGVGAIFVGKDWTPRFHGGK